MTQIAYLIAADQDDAHRMRRQLERAIDPPRRFIYVTDQTAALHYVVTKQDRVFISPGAYGVVRTTDVYVWLWQGAEEGVRADEQTTDFRWDYGDLPDMSVSTDVAAWLAS